jgi:hypothetical protein
MRWVGRGLLVGLCAWSLAGPAAAQPPPPQLPPTGAPVVASVPGATLVAFDHAGKLCLGLSTDEGPASCDAPPHGFFDPHVEGSGFGKTQMAYGVTSTDAVSVEVLAPGRRVTGPVSGGAYAGRFAGRVRFFLVAVPGTPYRLLLRDAAGRVVAGTDLGSTPAIGRPVEVAHGRLGGERWRAAVYQTTHLWPTPLDRGRTERLTCVRIVFGSEPPLDQGCSGPEVDPGAVSVTPREHCDPSALQLTGVAGSEVRGIDAVLGDGTRQRVPLYALPAGFGDARHAFALVLRPGTAVRALRLREGGRVRTLPVGQAPGGATCVPRSTNQGSFIIGLGFEAPHGSSTGPLIARDRDDLLCVGLGAIAAIDCRVPPIDPLLPRLEIRRSGGQTALLAVVPPEVAALRLTLDSGAPITVATTDLPGYTGRYAGLVRAVAVPLSAGRKVYDTDELAADGHVLQRLPGPDPRPLARTPAVLARLPGGIVVAGGGRCVQVSAAAPTRDPIGCHSMGFLPVLLAAPCAARRLVVVAQARQLRVATDRGVIRGRRKGRFAVAIVPRDAALREVRVPGVSRTPIRLPPAVQQCGYSLQT